MINPEKAIAWYRDEHRHTTQFINNYDLYEKIKTEFPQYTYPENPFQVDKSDDSPPEDWDAMEEDTQGFVQKLALSNLSEVWADDYDWAKRSYNNSISGTMYQILNGKMKYDVDMVSSGWGEDVAQFFVGLASPLDAGLFIGSGGLGGITAKAILGKTMTSAGGQLLKKQMLNQSASQIAKRGMLKNAINKKAAAVFAQKGTLESGLSLATYGAAGGFLQDSAAQRLEIENGEREYYDFGQAIWAGTKHGVTSGILGAAGGALTKGVMLPRLAKTRAVADKTFRQKAANLVFGEAGQVGAEAAVFTGGQLAEMKYLHGEDITMDKVYSTYMTNLMIIGGLKGGMKYAMKSKPALVEYNNFKKNLYKEVRFREKATLKAEEFNNKINKKKALEEAKNEADKDGNTELSSKLNEEINKINSEMLTEMEAAEIFGNQIPEYEKLRDKLNNSKISDLTPKEHRLLIEGTNAMNLLTLNALKEMRDNPELGLRAMGKQLYPKISTDKLNDKQKSYIKKSIDERIVELEKTNKVMNQTAIIGDDVEMRKFFAESFNVDIVENPKIPKFYDVIVTAPNGEKVMDFDALKILSKKQAEKIRKDLGKDIENAVVGEEHQIKQSKTPDNVGRTYVQMIGDKPYYEATGKLKTKFMTPIQMVADSKATNRTWGEQVKKGLNVNDGNMSNNESVQFIVDEIRGVKSDVKEIGKYSLKQETDMTISQGDYLAKEQKYFEFVNKKDSELSISDRTIRESVFEKGETKFLVDHLKQIDGGIVSLMTVLDMARSKAQPTILQNTQRAIKIVTYLSTKGLDIRKMNSIDISHFLKDGIPDFTVKIIKDNKIIDKNIRGTQLYNSPSQLSTMRQFLKALDDAGFITREKYNQLLQVVQGFHAAANEMRGLGIKPAKKTTRKIVLQVGKKLSQEKYFGFSELVKKDKLDNGYWIASQLAAKYYLRGEEISRLSGKVIKEILQFDKDTGQWYLDTGLTKERVVKSKTKERIIWVDNNLAKELLTYADIVINMGDTHGLNSGKHVTGITKLSNEKIGKVGTKERGFANQKSQLHDTRRRGQTEASKKLDGPDYRELNRMLGHEEGVIGKTYDVPSVKEQIIKQMELHTKIGSDIPQLTGKTNIEFLKIDRSTRPTKRAVHEVRVELFKEKYPELAIELLDKFNTEGIPPEAVGYLQDNVARILLGKAPSYAIPHEVGHHVFGILRAFRDASEKGKLGPDFAALKGRQKRMHKESINLLNQAEKIFLNKEGKFSEEYAVSTIDKVIDKMIDAPTMSKVQGWFKRFNRFIKKIFNKPLSKEELAWALGEKILSREGIPTIAGQVGGRKYLQLKDFASPKDYVNAINRDVSLVAEKFKFNKDETGGLVSLVATSAGIDNPAKFKVKLPIEPTLEEINNLESFHKELNRLNIGDLTKKKDTLSFLKLYREVEDKRIFKKDITLEKQKDFLVKLGVSEGIIERATSKQLEKYNEYLDTLDDIKTNYANWINNKEMSEFMTDKSLIKEAKNSLMVMAGPVHEAVASFGLKSLADKLRTHNHAMEMHIGDWVIFEHKATEAVGDNNFHGTSFRRGIKDHLWALDNKGEMLLEDLKWLSKVSSSEKKRIREAESFFRKAISDEWWDTINKKGTRGKDLSKYLRRKNGIYTPEAEVVRAHITLMEGYADKLPLMVGTKLTEAQTENWIKTNNINMIKDGIYMTRALTKEGKSVLEIDRKAGKKILDKLTDELLIKEAKKKFGDNYTTEQALKVDKNGQSLRDYARGLAYIELHNQTTFNTSRFGTRFLKTRHAKQDNYIYDERKGKYIRTYERDYANLTKSYVYGMSRFLANLQVFPELVSLDGFNYPGIKEQIQKLTSLRGQSAVRGSWVLDRIEKQVGLGNYEAPLEFFYAGGEQLARGVAKTGLSFWTSGLKNILTGTTQTLFAFDLIDIGRGFADIIKKDTRKMTEVRQSGAPETGMAIWEGGRYEKVLDAVSFKWGFMKPTEKFNRYFSVLASKHDQKRIIRNLNEYPPTHKLHKKALIRLREFYELNERDIQLLKNYQNVEGVELAKFASEFDRNKMIQEVKLVRQKLNAAAHVNTQGSTADIFMPYWAGSRLMRPLTLYKRMAYHATFNTKRSLKVSMKERNIWRPLVGMLATYGSGRLMMGTYSTLFGQEMPKENSPWWIRFWTTMWKGEFLGILSEVMSPYETNMIDSIHPASLEVVGETFNSVFELLGDKAYLFGDGGELQKFFKNNYQLYNATMKTIDKRTNEFDVRSKEFGKIYNQFEKEFFRKPDIEFEKTTRTPYYKQLRISFMKGTSEEFAKQYYLTIFGAAQEFIKDNKASSVEEALKMGQKEADKYLKAMNPNRGTFSKQIKDKTRSVQWLLWLKKHPRADEMIPELFKLEKEYHIKLAKYKAQMHFYSRKFNMPKMFKKFDWEIPQPFK